MFGAFQFQYTMDFFEIKTFGKSGMSHRLMRRFLLTACFKKEVVQIPVIHVLQCSEKVLSVHTLIPSLSSCLRSFCRRQLKRYFTFRSVRPSLSAISLIAML